MRKGDYFFIIYAVIVSALYLGLLLIFLIQGQELNQEGVLEVVGELLGYLILGGVLWYVYNFISNRRSKKNIQKD